ncbi:bifunctional diguanylate cyclase/phosphodiesterase [Planococcus donghaensis]|uniref:GGDEF domain-containing protein n=1 Tax=Planococcus donghaensis TaxID=414778 RepID=A0A1C7EHZ2_9BACL|nr:bifunctional diguanylate cyclase/phosphodiesterase [Planococcus donghaensis]ANU23276.1 GGDEF domain-containing protein [Planococcus donghaensis]
MKNDNNTSSSKHKKSALSDDLLYEDLFDDIVQQIPISLYVLNGSSYSYVNEHFCRLVGYTQKDILNGTITLENLIHPEDLPIIQKRILSDYDVHQAFARYRVRVYRSDGELLHVEIHSTKKKWQGKNVLFGTVIDITAEVIADLKLKEKEERLNSFFTYNPDAIFTFDMEGNFQTANQGCETISGYTIEEILQLSFTPFIVSEDLPKAFFHFHNALNGNASTYEIRIIRKDGEMRTLLATNFPMKSGGNIVGAYGMAKDITVETDYKKLMEGMVFFDPLTRLPNRTLFEDHVKQAIENNEPQLAIMFLNLDRFKLINDSFGHQFGDEYLKDISSRLSDNMDANGTVGRFAGDEFAVLLKGLDQHQIFQLAERFNDALAKPFEALGHSVSITASIGIAFSDGPDESVEGLIKKADSAMNYTKKHKIAQYTVYSEELDQQSAYRLTIERELKSALAKQEMMLHYQPIIDLKTNRLSAMEALIRWNHPELGFVPPDSFIPISEETGQIVSLGRWVLYTACAQNKAWQDQGHPPIKICVNISTIQLQQLDFVQTVIEILEETGLDAKWLELEVTESILLVDTELLKCSLQQLKKLGVSMSIDDFGTGFTSLSYLRQFSFDRIKIDRSFVGDISNDLNGKAITATIILLAHTLNMTVVAEGIEDNTQLAFLQDQNCNEGQGYYFGRPLPAELHDLTTLYVK